MHHFEIVLLKSLQPASELAFRLLKFLNPDDGTIVSLKGELASPEVVPKMLNEFNYSQ